MSRAAIFDAFRKAKPGLFDDPAWIGIIDGICDDAQIARDEPGDAFGAALAEVLKHEGGFVNHPRDPGGMTNLGVTKKTWEAWTGRPATEADMRALTPAKVTPLYRKNYWDKVCGDELHQALAMCVFDFAVNAGPSRAAKYLQTMLGIDRDGIVGPATVSAAQKFVATVGAGEAVRRYQQSRRNYYKQLGTFKTFGRGWLRRVDAVETAALRAS
jgi:lysozyme family protein